MSSNSISYKDLKTCRYLLRFSYIGTNYSGLQRQTKREEFVNNKRLSDDSIQYQIETAIQDQLRPIFGARLAISSRTDGGVHALLNTGHIDLTHPYVNTIYKPSFITKSVNRYLERNKQEIRLLSAQLVPNGFNARNSAKWRTYVYRLAIASQIESSVKYLDTLLPISEVNRCHIINNPNIEAMKRTVDLFIGRHDFSSFSPKPDPTREIIADPIKTILNLDFKPQCFNYINNEINSNISLWNFEIKCQSFLYNQIRRMMGSVIDVGLNRYPYEHIMYLLENPSYKNWSNQQTVAPAKGLWLTNVFYDESDLILTDELGNGLNEFANSYPNYKDKSVFIE